MGDKPLFPHVNTAYTRVSIKLLYNHTTLCLMGHFHCVDFMDVIQAVHLDHSGVLTVESLILDGSW